MVGSDTSFATIKSRFLETSLVMAFFSISLVSAANPIFNKLSGTAIKISSVSSNSRFGTPWFF